MHAEAISQFPGYAAIELLYTGSRTTVYRAHRRADDEPVILKVANTGHASRDEALARLRHEVAIIEAIGSPRVIGVFGVATLGDDAVLVVQDFGGESLDQYLARAQLSLADTLGIAIGVVAALRDIHAAGIIHKDVTPANIVFNATTGEVRLIDFDLATAWRTEHRGFVPPNTLEGTLRYMAPEQTGRMNRATDSRADLYAFGVTLFELLTGRLPFTDTDILSIVHAHVAIRPPAPARLDPSIPRPLSAIVMKLLAKAPEDRYQTAAGLLADLKTCASRFAATGAIAEFPLAGSDVARRFELPTKLYGRDAEHEVLAEAFQRIAGGSVETVLVGGHSGVGKTSVVRELLPVVTREHGYFLSGKFDQLRRDTPYTALVAAFNDLTHHLLTEGEDELAGWRERILSAIAPNARVVIDAVPALERVIGPQPAVVALDAAGTQNRFNLTLVKFLQVFSRRTHPLVLFLDDLQWADPETIQLLKLVAMSEATESLLLLLAFRDSEVSEGHPLMAAMRDLRLHRSVTRIDVEPLPTSEIAALIADALHSDMPSVAPLAALVCRKTDGNPFFVRQLLHALHEAGCIVFDPGLQRFTYDPASIENAPISENVADLLADSLRKLPESTRSVLAAAAAIGERFDLEMLARITGSSPAAAHAELSHALDHELVAPLSELEYVATAAGGGLVFRRLRFQHERIQSAAYSLMSPTDQQRMHLRIGELLVDGASPAELSDRIFDVVSHLNVARGLIETPEARAALARHDLMAARKARASAAYAAAIDCLEIAISLLCWDTDYCEVLDAHLMLAECCYLGGDIRRALTVLDDAADHAVRNRDRGALEALRAVLYIHNNDMKGALRYTRRAAALLGCVLPEAPAELGASISATFGAILSQLGDRKIEDLLELPPMTDLDALSLMTVLRTSIPAAFPIEPLLGVLVCAQMVRISLEHGNCAASAHGYVALGGAVLRNPELEWMSYPLARLGLDLNRQLDDRTLRPSVEFAFAAIVAPWHIPLDEAIPYLRDAARAGREVGDPIHAGNAAAFEISLRVYRGAEPLADICHDARIYRQQCVEAGDSASARLQTWQIDRMRVLMGDLDHLTAEEPDTQHSLVATVEEANLSHQFFVLAALVDTSYATGDYATALDLAIATQLLEDQVAIKLVVAEHQFYHCLAAAAMCRRRPARRRELEPTIEANQAKLARWASSCPANFEAMHLLVEAERAGLSSDLAAAIALYDRATASAARWGMRRLEAQCNELHGQLWLDRTKPELAQVYLVRARNLYATIGAQHKVRLLERKHPGIARAGTPLHLTSTITGSTASDVLDVTAIAKATRAISGELELDKLLERMLEIIFENAGAEGGALVLDTPEGLMVVASRTGAEPGISTTSVPVGEAVLPRTVVHYVQRTDTVVVLDDATADPRFGNDPYIRTCKPQSVLCIPVKHKDRAMGVLYLENTLVSGAFTQSRLDALMILVSQIAVSLENATLFAAQRVQAEAISRANDELRSEIAVREQAERELAQYRTHLEELIAERTLELTQANQKLRDAAAERERIEAELRLAQKLESVGRLAAGIAHEINTPVHRDRGEKTLVDLNRAIDSTLMIAANECKYVADVHTELAELPLVRCNGGEINQAVLNLVINAAHSIRDVVGDTGARGRITVSTRQDGSEVEIAIRDTGTGIPPAVRDKIYDPFFTTKDVGRGTGQGLAIVRSVVVDKHGGSLRFDTETGVGTTFFIRLPIGDAVDSAA